MSARPLKALSRYTALTFVRGGAHGKPEIPDVSNKAEYSDKIEAQYEDWDLKEPRTSIDAHYGPTRPLPPDYAANLGVVSNDQRNETIEEMRGSLDPFDSFIKKMEMFKSAGERNDPIRIPSVTGYRIIGCVCEEDEDEVYWMEVNKGEKKRCKCGHWFQIEMIEGGREE